MCFCSFFQSCMDSTIIALTTLPVLVSRYFGFSTKTYQIKITNQALEYFDKNQGTELQWFTEKIAKDKQKNCSFEVFTIKYSFSRVTGY